MYYYRWVREGDYGNWYVIDERVWEQDPGGKQPDFK